jgi:CheY-like chemotaxis protein
LTSLTENSKIGCERHAQLKHDFTTVFPAAIVLSKSFYRQPNFASQAHQLAAASSQRRKPMCTQDKSLRVLLVDDQDDILDMMHLLLKRQPYAVATANSGSKAIAVAVDFAPHVVVSDIGMPEMDGYEMMANLRRMDELSPFKAIALTGYDDAAEHDRARNAGFDAHLTKPVDFEHLFDVINQLSSSI